MDFDGTGYGRVAASADGIGRTYLGREIAGVMGWQGAGWLERQEREREEQGSKLLRELALRPGMEVAASAGKASRAAWRRWWQTMGGCSTSK